MNDTLWSREEHHLAELLTVPADNYDWALAEECDLDKATRSLVEIDWRQSDSPLGSLSDEIEDLFGQVHFHRDGSAESLTAKPPSYVRILYTPSDKDPQPFKSLQVIQFLDESEPDEDAPDDGAGYRVNRYVLAAAVRL
ncbi:uncharacterized protein BDZ83DRAFT_748035 [Colletotrichum acutatum]|uniref:Uncharacterized protein n=1 Tax=Glomerella acutata TaxID=27357 RepID=A0AAD8XLJ5_GLOAC|nr:uncharacterized protein BDZ83DRAFT_748035 [Colletotrichum acutatum]KAK1729635.1 hypothetical protein BDZ83DRAFT_748035 [Colletotrichum acutatum]